MVINVNFLNDEKKKSTEICLFFLNRKNVITFVPPKFPPINIHRGKNKLRNLILLRFDPSGLPYQHDDKRLL